MVFFCHIHRAAGSTIHGHFFEHLRDADRQRHFVVDGPGALPDVSRRIAQLPDRRFYLGGHVGLHDLEANDIVVQDSDPVFSLVRDPIERAISLYFLALRSPEWFPHFPKEISHGGFGPFYEYARANGYYFHNDQCRLIGGQESFETAARTMERRFHIVGSVSRMRDFELAVVRACSPIMPGFHAKQIRLNAAFQTQESGIWTRRAEIDDILTPVLRSRVSHQNEEDARLVSFICGEHRGLFFGSGAANESHPRI